jgi:hypothetical protein
MSCTCGNHAVALRNATHRDASGKHELSFRVCGQCGRLGYERLIHNGQTIAQGVMARQQFQSLQSGPTERWGKLVGQSLYHPYKLWRFPEREPVLVCLIKLEGNAIGLCPEYELCVEGEDYLEVSRSLGQKVREACGCPAGATLTTTDSAPFDLTWGKRPATIRQDDQTPRMKLVHDAGKPEQAPEPAYPEPPATTPARAQSHPPANHQPTEQDQLDFFG